MTTKADSATAPAAAPPTGTPFGKTTEGTAVSIFTLRNEHGLQATISTLGGTLTSLLVPDKNGKPGDVVLGFDKPDDYTSGLFIKESPYFGALIGRYGNRINLGRFTLDGQAYRLPINNAPNSLHGGTTGFNRRVWQATPGTSADGPTLALAYHSADGEEGYPGALDVKVVYTLTNANALRLDYTATADKATVLNLTNHSYFNLTHGQDHDIPGHVLTINADRFTPVGNTLIPTGALQAVAGTPMDFRQRHAIGERIGQVPGAAPGGYDHNWVLPTRCAAARPRRPPCTSPRRAAPWQCTPTSPACSSTRATSSKATSKAKAAWPTCSTTAFASKPSTSPIRPTSRRFPAPCCGRAKRFIRRPNTASACANKQRPRCLCARFGGHPNRRTALFARERCLGCADAS